MWLCKATSPMLEISIALLQTTHIALDFDVGSAAIQALNFSFAFPFPLKTHFPIITKRKNSQRRTTASAWTRTNIASFAQLTRETNKPWCIANTMNHNAMQGIGNWALGLETISFSDRTASYYECVSPFAKLIQVKSATLQRFQLAFKHLLLLKKNSRLNPIFQDFAFNFHTFSRSGKVVRKFPDFLPCLTRIKNSFFLNED